MIGMVIVTHGGLAREFLATLVHIVGPQENVVTVSIGPDDDAEQRRSEIVAAVKATDKGSGVVILTDMFGGTPSNLAISVIDELNVEVIAGVNLPLLIKLARLREGHTIAQAVDLAKEAGRKYISVASQVLAGEN